MGVGVGVSDWSSVSGERQPWGVSLPASSSSLLSIMCSPSIVELVARLVASLVSYSASSASPAR